MFENLINDKSKNSFDNELKDIIASTYRRFLLRICNERISILKFAIKLNFSPKKLELYNEENLKTIFKKFDYINYWLTFDEAEYLHSIGYNNANSMEMFMILVLKICIKKILIIVQIDSCLDVVIKG